MKQQAFWAEPEKEHGGSNARGKRKSARAITTKSPMHVTFKSTRARGAWSFFRHYDGIEELVHAAAKRWRIRVMGLRNVGNHLHLLARAATRREMQNFLREVAGKVATLITNARKGHAVGKFWDDLVHSRIVHWGRDLFQVKQYLEKNGLEAAGVPRALADDLYERIRREIW